MSRDRPISRLRMVWGECRHALLVHHLYVWRGLTVLTPRAESSERFLFTLGRLIGFIDRARRRSFASISTHARGAFVYLVFVQLSCCGLHHAALDSSRTRRTTAVDGPKRPTIMLVTCCRERPILAAISNVSGPAAQEINNIWLANKRKGVLCREPGSPAGADETPVGLERVWRVDRHRPY